MVIAFWNVHRNLSLDSILIDLVREYGVDILILAEYRNTTTIDGKELEKDDMIVGFLEKAKKFNLDFLDIPYRVSTVGDVDSLTKMERLRILGRFPLTNLQHPMALK